MQQQIFSRLAVLNLKNNCVKLFKTHKNKQETKFKTISFLLFLFLFLCLSQQCAKSSHQCFVVFQQCLNSVLILSQQCFRNVSVKAFPFQKGIVFYFKISFVNSVYIVHLGNLIGVLLLPYLNTIAMTIRRGN